MLNTYTTSSQTVANASNISFATNGIFTSPCITHTAGTDTITLNRSGYYRIEFNADGAATSTVTAPIVLQLYNDGVAVPGAEASSTSAGTTDIRNLSFSTVIKVNKSCPVVNNAADLTVQNTGVAATITNANFVVTRLG